MNQKQKDIAAKWVEALRSGKYEQGPNYLRTRDEEGVERFCCLGVLCDILPDVTWQEHEYKAGFIAVHEGCGSDDELPQTLSYSLGLGGHLGDIDPECKCLNKIGHGGCPNLACLNDNGATFAQIADLIEAHPEAIFADLLETEAGEKTA